MSLPNFAHLNEQYAKLCDLVQNSRDFTDEKLQQFKEILDAASPQTNEEAAQAMLIRRMTKSSRRCAMYIFGKMGCQGLVLWSGATGILRHFRLKKKIYLKWDDGYVVKRFDPAAKHPDPDSRS